MLRPAIRRTAARCAQGLAHTRQPLSIGARPWIPKAGAKALPRAPLSTTASRLGEEMSLLERLKHPFRTAYELPLDSRHEGIELDTESSGLKPNSPWGIVVYRTCYDDEAAWQKIRAKICDVERSFLYWNRYLIDRHKPVFMDDKARFDGADRVKIRDHFREWSKAEYRRNTIEREPTQQEVELSKALAASNQPKSESLWNNLGMRYNVFGVVDDVCIESVHRGGWHMPLLMLINIDWKPVPPPTEEEIQQEQYHTDWDEGFMVDHSEGPGGWIYTQASRYVEYYDLLDSSMMWDEDFMFNYPSQVYEEMGLDKSPGFWREEIAARKAKENNPKSKKN